MKQVKIQYLKGITDLTELRKTYHKLALQYHPDRGGDTAIMQQINAEFEYLSETLLKNGEFQEWEYRREQQTNSVFMEMMDKIIRMKGVVIEIIGSWIWITGDTKQYREYLKEIGFIFSGKKVAWYWHAGEYRKWSRNGYSLNQIRTMYGTRVVEAEEEEQTAIKA